MRSFRKRTIVLVLVLFLLVTSFCISLKTNVDFFNASVTQYLSLFVIITVSYWVTQNKLDERSKLEQFIKLLQRLSETVSALNRIEPEEDLEAAERKIDQMKSQMLISIRQIKNIITTLKKYELKGKDIENAIAYLDEKIIEYNAVFSDHVAGTNKCYSKETKTHLDCIGNLMIFKCDDLIVILYKF